MAPLGSARVVHPGWAAHHAPVAVGTMNALCRIELGSTGGGWIPETGTTPGTPVVTYAGRCRVAYARTQPHQGDAADQVTTTSNVTVALPLGSAEQHRGARVTITAVDANGPAALVGRVLLVESVAYPSLAVEQVMTCTDDQTNQGA